MLVCTGYLITVWDFYYLKILKFTISVRLLIFQNALTFAVLGATPRPVLVFIANALATYSVIVSGTTSLNVTSPVSL